MKTEVTQPEQKRVLPTEDASNIAIAFSTQKAKGSDTRYGDLKVRAGSGLPQNLRVIITAGGMVLIKDKALDKRAGQTFV